MADRNKAIRILEGSYKNFVLRHNGELLTVNELIALLKAQEPVEPMLDVDEWRCGNCGHKLEHQELLGDNVLFHEQYNYCPDCGRKVKQK